MVQMMMRDEMSLSHVSCVFFISYRWSWNESKCHFYCPTLCTIVIFLFWMVLKEWSWKESKIHCIWMVLKEVKIQRVSSMEILMLSIEGSSMEVEVLYKSNVMVLKGVNLMLFSTIYISDGLEMSQFCLYTQWYWKESILDANFTV